MNRQAVFLDRDGVLVRDVGHLHKKEQIELLPGVESLKKLQNRGFVLFVISNQSAVARGLMTEDEMWKIDEIFRQKLKEKGVFVKRSYYCPHHPEITGDCLCRKPNPRLILKAKDNFNIKLASSITIGDKLDDLKAGEKAGIKTGILVKRNGEFWDATEIELEKIKLKFNSIKEVVNFVLKEHGHSYNDTDIQ